MDADADRDLDLSAYIHVPCESFGAVTAALTVRYHANQSDQYAAGALLCALWLGHIRNVHPIRRNVAPCMSDADLDSAMLAAAAVVDSRPWAERGIDRSWALGVYNTTLWAGGGRYPPTPVSGVSPERPTLGIDRPQLDRPQHRRPAVDLQRAHEAMWRRIRAERAALGDLHADAGQEESDWLSGVNDAYDWLMGETSVGPMCDGPADVPGLVGENLDLAYSMIRKEAPSPMLSRRLTTPTAKAVGVAQLIEYAYELRPDPPLCWPRPAAHRYARGHEAA